MPGFQIHIAIAKRYIEKNAGTKAAIKNLQLFYDGNIAPDLTTDKNLTHYGSQPKYDHKSLEDLYELATKKTSPAKYLAHNEIKNDFDRGVFLHLITDYKFYTEFFNKEYYKNRIHRVFLSDLYKSYGLTNGYIEKKYDLQSIGKYVDFTMLEKLIFEANDRRHKENHETQYEPKKILHENEIDKFIEEVSSMDLKSTIEFFRNSSPEP